MLLIGFVTLLLGYHLVTVVDELRHEGYQVTRVAAALGARIPRHLDAAQIRELAKVQDLREEKRVVGNIFGKIFTMFAIKNSI